MKILFSWVIWFIGLAIIIQQIIDIKNEIFMSVGIVLIYFSGYLCGINKK